MKVVTVIRFRFFHCDCRNSGFPIIAGNIEPYYYICWRLPWVGSACIIQIWLKISRRTFLETVKNSEVAIGFKMCEYYLDVIIKWSCRLFLISLWSFLHVCMLLPPEKHAWDISKSRSFDALNLVMIKFKDKNKCVFAGCHTRHSNYVRKIVAIGFYKFR